MEFGLAKMRRLIKGALKNRKTAFNVAKNGYYLIKYVADYLFFKMNYPGRFWILKMEGDGSAHSYSQHGQDLLIMDYCGQNGVYVEIGCNHPFRLSNSALLEEVGWSGVSIDPLNKYSDLWLERKNDFINHALGKDKSTRTFVEFYGDEDWVDMMSGFKEYVRREDMDRFQYRTYSVNVSPLNDVISPMVSSIDVLMIDVEGAELDVLGGIDMKSLAPSYILIENAGELGGSEAVRAYLFDRGYEILGRIGATDDFFKKVNA